MELGFGNKFPAREDTSLDLAVTNEKAHPEAKVKNALSVHYLILSIENE